MGLSDIEAQLAEANELDLFEKSPIGRYRD